MKETKRLSNFIHCRIGCVYHADYTYLMNNESVKKSFEFLCVSHDEDTIRGLNLDTQTKNTTPWGRPHDDDRVSGFVLFEITQSTHPEYFI